MKKCISEGIEWSEELILVTSRKRERWVRVKGFPVYEDSHMIRIQGTIQDITEEKAKTLETENQLGLLKNLLNASTEYAFIATDVEGVVTTFNHGAERLLGYSAEELLFKHTPLLWHLESEIKEREETLSQQNGESIQGFGVFASMANKNEVEAALLDSVGNTLHTLKGVCGNAGAMRLKEETEAFEAYVRNKEIAPIQEQLPQYLRTLKKTQSMVQEFIS